MIAGTGHFQVNYGEGWEDTGAERAKRILADHFVDLAFCLKELKKGQVLRTTFARYRINPAYL